jgi:hypothetical protein
MTMSNKTEKRSAPGDAEKVPAPQGETSSMSSTTAPDTIVVLTSGEKVADSIVAYANVEGVTGETLAAQVAAIVRGESDRTAISTALIARIHDLPNALMATTLQTVQNTPYQSDPTDFVLSLLIAAHVAQGLAESAGFVRPVLPAEISAEAETSAVALIERLSTPTAKRRAGATSATTGTRRQYEPFVLPAGTYSHAFASGAIVTATADGIARNTLTFNGAAMSPTAAYKAAREGSGETAEFNGWTFWHIGADGTGETIDSFDRVVKS